MSLLTMQGIPKIYNDRVNCVVFYSEEELEPEEEEEVSSPPPFAPQVQPKYIPPGYDYEAGMCPGGTIEGSQGSVEECATACNKHPKCAAFMYVDVDNDKTQQCWLKSKTCQDLVPEPNTAMYFRAGKDHGIASHVFLVIFLVVLLLMTIFVIITNIVIITFLVLIVIIIIIIIISIYFHYQYYYYHYHFIIIIIIIPFLTGIIIIIIINIMITVITIMIIILK